MNGTKHFLWLFLGLLLAGSLSGCGDLPRPFKKSGESTAMPVQAPQIVLSLPADVSFHVRRRLATALQEAARRRGIAIVTANTGDSASDSGQGRRASWRLIADFQPYRDEAGGRRLAYLFQLLDAHGRQQLRIAGDEPVREGPPDPFDGMEAVALPRMAETVAERLSARLALLGYGTQGAGLPPPPDVLVEAGPKAEEEIDPDLLAALTVPSIQALPGNRYSVGYGLPSGSKEARELPSQVGGASMGGGREPMTAHASSRRRIDTGKHGSPYGKVHGKGKVRIASVAVTGVTGAPGAGNAELKSALMGLLKRAGWPVKTVAQHDSLKIAGKVSRHPAGKGRVRVRIVWTARGPDGRVFGTVKQENVVPASTIAHGFGPAAYDIAQGAAEGLFQLVAQLKKGR